MEALRHYGGINPTCKCCGESNMKFLTIDHIEGGGSEHRRGSAKGGIGFWLKKNEYPDGFQILCFNCNCGKGIYGVCPHSSASDIMDT